MQVRIDKFLKVSRVIKRRTLAKEICDSGQVSINGRTAKAGSEVKPGDIVLLKIGMRRLKFEIVSVRENVPAKQAGELYGILEDVHTNEIN